MSGVALYFAQRGIAWSDLAAEIRHADYVWLVPAVIVIVIGQLLRAGRWQVLFGDGPRPAFRASFAILSVGYLVSGLFPLRLGDPVRAWLVESRTPAGGAEALATVLVERAIDFLTVVALLALWVPTPASRLLRAEFAAGRWAEPGNLRLVALGLVLAVYAALVMLSTLGERSGRLAERSLVHLGAAEPAAERAGALVAGFATGFSALRKLKTAALAAGWSMVVWLVGGLGYWLVFRAFSLDLPFAAAVFAMCATALFAILPSSPGYIGVFHYAIRVALGIYSDSSGAPVGDAQAVSYAIVLHGTGMVVLLVLGLVGLWLLDMSGAELTRRLQVPDEAL